MTDYDEGIFITGPNLETRAKLLIYTGDMLPDKVTELLQIEPSEILRKGESVTNRIGRTRIHKLNAWFLYSEPKIDSLDLSEHLNYVLETIYPAKEQLLSLHQNKQITMRIDCVWYSKGDTSGISLSSEQMKKMSELNLECSFNLWFFYE